MEISKVLSFANSAHNIDVRPKSWSADQPDWMAGFGNQYSCQRRPLLRRKLSSPCQSIFWINPQKKPSAYSQLSAP